MAIATLKEKFIPVCEPLLDGDEVANVLECFDTNWISSKGRFIPLFEERFSGFCGASHGVACSSGTAAIHLALEALGIGPGDEVIIPTFTLIASANMVCLTGATPVLVDVEPDTWCIDRDLIEAKITPRTKALMVVHMYGHPCDMNAVTAIADRHGLAVIEDCAQAHGAEDHGRRVGSIGTVGVFSFYGNKLITTGEGGMLITSDAKLAQRAALLRDQAFEPPRFIHRAVGFNYRMTNIQAAVGVAQCDRLEDRIAHRVRMAQVYGKLLCDCDDVELPVCRPWAKNIYWMYGLLIKPSFGRSADDVRAALKQNGVDSRAFFHPLHRQPVYDGTDPRWPDLRGTYPVADDLSDRGLYLPSGPMLTREDQCRVVQQLLRTRDRR